MAFWPQNESTSRLSTPVHSSIEMFSGQQAADIMAQEIAMRVKLREKIRRTSELLEREKNSQQGVFTLIAEKLSCGDINEISDDFSTPRQTCH